MVWWLLGVLLSVAVFTATWTPSAAEESGSLHHPVSPSHRDLRRKRRSSIEDLLYHPEPTIPYYVKTSEWWEVDHPYMNKFQGHHHPPTKLYLRRYDYENSFLHSCYQYRAMDVSIPGNHTLIKENKFCYPTLMITGVPKCSTSALYQILRRFRHVHSLLAKEVCGNQFLHASLHNYFDALGYVPNDGSLLPGYLIMSACIDLDDNLYIREILRQPNTFYMVVIRDYADWLWSSYNYWCSAQYERNCTHFSQWILPEAHQRSPEHFHHLIMGAKDRELNDSVTNSQPIRVLFDTNPCQYAQHAFSHYTMKLWLAVGVENTLIIASEELERNLEGVLSSILTTLGFDDPENEFLGSVEDFKAVRFNTNSKAGENSFQTVSEYLPGVYAVSGWRPMLPETRAFLRICWQEDCHWASQVTGHAYNCSWRGVLDVADDAAVQTAATALHAKLQHAPTLFPQSTVTAPAESTIRSHARHKKGGEGHAVEV